MNKKHVIIDTDTYNEVDDQFALSYALLSQDVINIESICIAPFLNKRVDFIEEGIEKSYREANYLLKLLHQENIQIYKGSRQFLDSYDKYIENDASRHLVEMAMQSESKIIIVALAALTNIASAILMEPRIVDKISIVWLGGHDYNQDRKNEFNLRQDIIAANIVFDSQVRLIQVPCKGMIDGFVLTQAELETYVFDKNKIGTYLTKIFKECNNGYKSYSRVIADLLAVVAVVHPEWVVMIKYQRPHIDKDLSYCFTNSKDYIWKVNEFDRNNIMSDLIMKISGFKD